MTLAYFVFMIIRAIVVVMMAYSFHYGLKEKGVLKSIIFWLFALMLLDVIIQMEELRP
ncbi:hypothetical protein Slash_16 [Bacillus phage Slash]|uniref:Uncharacterized protein n=1 Tax=Bacillus phage Slash TaxID=1406790 RepID=U5PWC6_9CAUD|nr:hypothetical protein Slash_16 [Bacillus phage Slash]AGY48305.1 hypothetical protein Slash_16 [Bacillus phage Slash]